MTNPLPSPVKPVFERTLLNITVGALPPDQQLAVYLPIIEQGAKTISPTLARLQEAGKASANMRPEEAAPLLRKQLGSYYSLLGDHLPGLSAALDLDDGDTELLRKKLAQSQSNLAETQGALFKLQQEQQLWQRDATERQAAIDDLQKRNAALEARLSEFEGRVSTEPVDFGQALGHAVDAIQLGLTSLQNPYVDYGLQELDLQTQVNLQIDAQKRLTIRFPGVNEQIAPQNLSQLQLRLRPIPKTQQDPVKP